MAELPTGTLTMFFSDIERSTVLLRRLRDRWGEALSAHRAIVRGAVREHGGTELGTEGDSFFVVFRSAHDAVATAVAVQRGIAAHLWPDGERLRVRIGLHTGEPQRHDDGYVGEDVHRAARISSTARGGQIVVSEATARLVAPDVDLRDLGWHRLRDLPGEEHLFDVLVAGLPSEFAPLSTLGKRAALPFVDAPLIGRDRELAELLDLIIDHHARLVTLTGPGGSGKSRLAAAVAAALEPTSQGVYFVALHTVRTAERMWAAIADAVDCPVAADTDLATRLPAHLSDRQVLLVLDNLEQIDAADRVVAELLSATRSLAVLATSRRPLLLAGERSYPVAPLPPPTSTDDGDVAASPAVQLFVSYAQRVSPAFAVTDANRADVAELCRRLDGLPLALELAAAQSALISPRALLDRLSNRLGSAMTTGDRPDRQRTLGATIAWSYDLLDGPEQAVFRRLGVFAASCDLDAVDAVAAAPDVDALDVATRLVAANMVRVEPSPAGEPRLGMLETIRSFALERLIDAGEAEDARRRHLEWCLTALRREVELVRGPLHTRATDAIAAIEPDVRASLDWALRPAPPGEDSPLATGLALLGVATEYWYRFGRPREARAWQERGLAAAGDNDSAALVTVLHGLGITLLQQGDVHGGMALFSRSLDMTRRLGDEQLEARALNDLAVAHRSAGDPGTALEYLQANLDMARAAGNAKQEATALANMVVVLLDLERFGEAAEMAHAAMDAHTRNEDEYGLAVDRLNYMTALLATQGLPATQAYFVEHAAGIVAMDDQELTVELLEMAVILLAGTGHPAAAAQLLGAADGLRAAADLPRRAPDDRRVSEAAAAAKATLDPAEWERAYAAGSERTPAAAITLATSQLSMVRDNRG